VAHPLLRKVTDYAEFTGRTDAKETVSIRARVTGYLLPLQFKDGTEVNEGDTLFEIDPRPYQAQLDEAISQVKINEASLNLAQVTYDRDKAVLGQSPGAISKQQLDQDAATVTEAEARLKSAKASTEVYKLNLDFTKVTAPISGRVSRAYYTKGNLVIQDQTLLTTIVSLDPMFAYFDMDEPTLLRIQQGINSGLIERVKDSADIPVDMALQGETNYPHRGKFSFINNVVNASTGSISARGEFENKKSPEGVRLLLPGMFVRIRLPIGQAHDAILVIDSALASDQGLKYVYVVDPKSKKVDPDTKKVTWQVQYRRVQTGPLQPDGMRVIREGLKTDELIVVGGLQQVQPRKYIEIAEGEMPTLTNGEPADAPSSVPAAPSERKKPKGSGSPAADSSKPTAEAAPLPPFTMSTTASPTAAPAADSGKSPDTQTPPTGIPGRKKDGK
jgi:multidrug efflux system membrane fusion protein